MVKHCLTVSLSYLTTDGKIKLYGIIVSLYSYYKHGMAIDKTK